MPHLWLSMDDRLGSFGWGWRRYQRGVHLRHRFLAIRWFRLLRGFLVSRFREVGRRGVERRGFQTVERRLLEMREPIDTIWQVGITCGDGVTRMQEAGRLPLVIELAVLRVPVIDAV